MKDLLVVTFPLSKKGGGAERTNNLVIRELKKRYDLKVLVPISVVWMLYKKTKLDDEEKEDLLSASEELDPDSSACLEYLLKVCKVYPSQLLTEVSCLRKYGACDPRAKVSLNLNGARSGSALVDMKVVRSEMKLAYLHDYLELNSPRGSFYPYPSFDRRAHPIVKEAALTLDPGPPHYTYPLPPVLVQRTHQLLSFIVLKRYFKRLRLLIVPSPGALEEYPFLASFNVKTLDVCAPAEVGGETKSTRGDYFVLASSIACVRKGVLDAIFSWAHIPIDYDLVIPGDFPSERFERALKNLVKRLDIEEKVKFVGRLSHESFVRLMAESRGVLMPTYFDNCPLTGVEALALGKRLIVYDYPPVYYSLRNVSRILGTEPEFVPQGRYLELAMAALEEREEGEPRSLDMRSLFLQRTLNVIERILNPL